MYSWLPSVRSFARSFVRSFVAVSKAAFSGKDIVQYKFG